MRPVTLALWRVPVLALMLSACATSASQMATREPVAEIAPPPVLPELPDLSAFDLTNCAYSDDPTVALLSRKAVLYCGLLNTKGAHLLDDMGTAETTTLLIASGGGVLEAPLDIADIVVRNDLSVIAVGPCFSGCASAVFIAGNDRYTLANAQLGFHNTATSATEIAKATFGQTSVFDFAPLQARSRREIALYDSMGIDRALLLDPQSAIVTVCITVNGKDAVSGETVLNIASQFDLWVPSNAQLAHYGLNYVELNEVASPTIRPLERFRLVRTKPIRSTGSGNFIRPVKICTNGQ
jgi:hypothetical protein